MIYRGKGELSLIERVVLDLKRRHSSTWRDRSNLYWLWRFLGEAYELVLALCGLHDDPIQWELWQIAATAMNWAEKRWEDND